MSEANAEQLDSEQSSELQDQTAVDNGQDIEPIAIVRGEAVVELPQDLYIPPHALEVILETFEGPLDLLLYLIRRHNLDILDIPIAAITRQYMEYVDLMRDLRLELAGEYLLMAAMLAEIKSRMLLPRQNTEEQDEDDPRAELVRRLQEYERVKIAAQELEILPRFGKDTFATRVQLPKMEVERPLPEVSLKELLVAMADVMKRADIQGHHQVQREALTVREKMTEVLDRINNVQYAEFSELFTAEDGRAGVVVTFIAILELLRQAMIDIVQNEPFSTIHVKAVSSEEEAIRTCD